MNRLGDTSAFVIPAGRVFFFGARIWLRMTFNYPVLWARVRMLGYSQLSKSSLNPLKKKAAKPKKAAAKKPAKKA